MPTPLFDIEGLQSALLAGHTVLTPNRRLARHIGDAWAQHCHRQGHEAWRQAPIQTIDTWLEQLWQTLEDCAYAACLTHSVVNSHAERLIWEQVIDHDPDKPATIDAPVFARLTQTTLQQLQRWQVPLREVANSGHEASQHFLRWQNQFAATMDSKGLLTGAQSQALILQAFNEGILAKHESVLLVGFQTPPPPLSQHILAAAFTEVSYWTEAKAPGAQQLYTATSDTDEITAAAQWAFAQIQSSPEHNIGVVFPNLSSQRHRVDRIFRETFTPNYCLPNAPHDIPPFNLSAGISLADSPLAVSALSLLNLQHSPHPWQFYCQLLNDPFWGHADNEQITRAHCQLLLRKSRKPRPGTADFRYWMQQAEQACSTTNLLSQGLQQIEEKRRRQPATATFRYWVEHFSADLDLLGWPGTRSLDSIEYQQLQLWFEILDELTHLDHAIDPVNVRQALAQLNRICRERIFQPEGVDSPVQVLGVLEAAGLHFDKLWLAEMHDNQWPQTSVFNPLLSVSLQRQYGMPKSSAETELGLAQQLLADFSGHCQHIVFSFAQRDGDSERQITHLLSDALPRFHRPEIPDGHPLLANLAKPQLEKLPVDRAPTLTASETIRGGSAILRDQARCPFNAFSVWRLGAEPLPEPEFGFSAIERGNAVHRSLELFWQACKDHGALISLDEVAQSALLRESITSCLALYKSQRPELFGPRYSELEAQRLQDLLTAWLKIERARKPFVVRALEQQVSFQLDQLDLSLRVDRVDQLSDGSNVLIDYKTGGASIAGFTAERPEEPQLLLYALAMDGSLAALCFGQISATKGIAIKGIGSQALIADGLTDLADAGLADNWPENLHLWRQRLSGLAKDFCQGHAEMAVYSRTVVDYQSYLFPLNRWFETLNITRTTVDEAAEADN